MSEVGRAPSLTGEKAREGGRGIVVDPLEPREIAGLTPPKYLGPEGCEVWFAALKTLGAARHLSHGDLPTLAQGCLDWQRWKRFEAEIERKNRETDDRLGGELDETPSGFRQMGQLRILADRAKRDWQAVARQFGLTPVARVRTAGAAQGDFFAMMAERADRAERGGPAPALDPRDPFEAMH